MLFLAQTGTNTQSFAGCCMPKLRERASSPPFPLHTYIYHGYHKKNYFHEAHSCFEIWDVFLLKVCFGLWEFHRQRVKYRGSWKLNSHCAIAVPPLALGRSRLRVRRRFCRGEHPIHFQTRVVNRNPTDAFHGKLNSSLPGQ